VGIVRGTGGGGGGSNSCLANYKEAQPCMGMLKGHRAALNYGLAASWHNRPVCSHASQLFLGFFAYLLVFTVIYFKVFPFQCVACEVSAQLTHFNLCRELKR